jgi:DNA-directed RNA polymerase subunit F
MSTISIRSLFAEAQSLVSDGTNVEYDTAIVELVTSALAIVPAYAAINAEQRRELVESILLPTPLKDYPKPTNAAVEMLEELVAGLDAPDRYATFTVDDVARQGDEIRVIYGTCDVWRLAVSGSSESHYVRVSQSPLILGEL